MIFEVNEKQKKILKFCTMYPNDSSYNIVKLTKLSGKLDVQRFKRSFELLISDFDSFKTNILKSGDEFFQQYIPERCIELSVVYGVKYNKIKEYVTSMKNTPIDVTSWPCVHFTLYVCSPDESYFLFAIPHIFADVYSEYFANSLISQLYNSAFSIDELKNKKAEFEIYSYIGHSRKPKISAKAKEFFLQQFSVIDSLETKKIKQQRDELGRLKGRQVSFEIVGKNYNIVQEKCAQWGVTEYSYFLSAYAVLLSKLIGENVLTVGIPLADRHGTSEKKMVGYMVNTLPMVIKIEENANFERLAKQINIKMIKLLRFKDTDINSLGLDIKGNINNILTFYNSSENLVINGCNSSEEYIKTDNIMNELQLVIVSHTDIYKVMLQLGEYFDGFDFESAFVNVIEQSSNMISDISLLKKNDIESTYKVVNNFSEYNSENTVSDIFKNVTERFGDNTAVTFNGKNMTYAELDKISDKIACFLIENYPHEKFVAYSVKRDEFLIPLILGVVKSGKILVPIDLQNPVERRKYILNDLGSVLFINEEDNIDSSASVISKSDFFSIYDKYTRSEVQINIEPDDNLYMIYTSGTTGKPKGVTITHKNLCSLIKASEKIFDFDEKDVWTMFHSYSFDFSMWEMFGCLLSGGRLVVIDTDLCKSSDDFYKLVCNEKVTVLSQTPTAFKRFSESDSRICANLCLKYVIFGGENLNIHILKDWVSRHDAQKIQLINMYGITETTIHVTSHKISENEVLSNISNNIGKPLSNAEVYILDNDKNPLPFCAEGEIAVAGDGVANGYYNRKELTNNKFKYSTMLGKYVYLSGDIGRINKSGDIYYIGRKDTQIQIRGYRVELSEIESALSKYCQNCAVITDKDKNGNDRLLAFVVCKDEFDEKIVKLNLRRLLPAYMIPSRIVRTNDIPQNVNGKTDVNALRSKLCKTHTIISFSGKEEKIIYDIIVKVTDIDGFDENDNLFDMGINSMHLPSICEKIKSAFSLEKLDVMTFFEYTSVGKLAEYVRNLKI